MCFERVSLIGVEDADKKQVSDYEIENVVRTEVTTEQGKTVTFKVTLNKETVAGYKFYFELN